MNLTPPGPRIIAAADYKGSHMAAPQGTPATTGKPSPAGSGASLTPYTGDVSVLAIMDNLKAGKNTFPQNMGDTISHPVNKTNS